jgi:hypothetical protein
VVKNLGDAPAFKVNTVFTPEIKGVNGTKMISSLAVFKNIEFLAPHKEIKVFLDTSSSYFAVKQVAAEKDGRPERISVKISYKDARGQTVSGVIQHDLGIYKDLGYIKKIPGNTLS